MRKLALALLVPLVCVACGPKEPFAAAAKGLPNPKRAIWFWHSPFDLSAPTEQALDRCGVTDVFVRAATFSFDGERVQPILRQKWLHPSRLAITATYNFDAGALRHFEDITPEAFATAILATFREDQRTFTARGGKFRGLQLDIDCPTRLLPRYAQLTAAVKQKIPAAIQFSITGLTSWLSSDDLKNVLAPVDFFVPQFYEAEIPKTLREQSPVGNLANLKRGMAICGRLGKPFYVGSPAYGQCLLYDAGGNLSGTYRGLSPEDAMRHPSLQLVSTEATRDEERVQFRAIHPGQNGRGKGYQLVYRMPTAETVRKYEDAVIHRAPANCLGLAYFRVPEEGESMVLTLVTLEAAILRRPALPEPKITYRATSRPWNVIESGQSEGVELEFQIKNQGTAATAFSEDGIEAIFTTEVGSIEEARAQSGTLDPFESTPESVGKVSLGRARGLRFRRARLGPGESVSLGPIVLNEKKPWRLEWSFRTSEGNRIRGHIEPSISPKSSTIR